MSEKKMPVPTESQEQIAVINWASYMSNRDPRYGLLFHIPNGGSRGKAEAGRFRAEGVKSGVPDLFLPVPVGVYAGAFVEMKRIRDGRVSEEQKNWLVALQNQGYFAKVCYGAEDAIRTLKSYMEGHT